MEMRVEGDATQIAESDSLSLDEHSERLAAAVAGSFSMAQVYFSGPDAWIAPTIFVRLYGRRGGGRLLLSEVPLATAVCTSEDGKSTALAISVTGVHVDGFEVVVAQDDDAGVLVTDGRILLVASPGGAAADIRPGAPPALQQPMAQGAAAGLSGRWPVYLCDGGAEVGSAVNALHIRKSDRRAAYYVSATEGSGTNSTSDKPIIHVWNGSATNRRVEIRRITIAYLAGVGGTLTVRGTHITTEPEGATEITPAPLDPSDGASSALSGFKASGTTRVSPDLILFAVPFSATGAFVWTWTDLGKPIVLPRGMSSGFEIRVDVSATATAAMTLHVSIEWLEV